MNRTFHWTHWTAALALLMAVLGGRAAIPAFPGAEGFGAYANGGRGGDVYYVNNLNTSGAGSFADAIATVPASGRTIVFSVSGYIHVNKTSLGKSKVTIAGQTAPGDGIGFKDGTFIINGSDVVIRHARFRYGDQAAGGDCINLDDGVTNVILDHVSLAFSTDENISSFSQSPRPDLMTFQWSLNAWGLESHSCGGLWDLNRVTTHHTLWAHHHTRNPKARPDGLLDWINNVTFDWGIGFIMGDSTTPAAWKANVRGNYFICPPGNVRSFALEKASIDRNGNYNFTLHVGTNLFDKNGNAVLDGSDYGYGLASGSYQISNAPVVVAGAQVPVAIDPPLTAYKKIVSRAGPVRLDALSALSLRDEVDTILLSNLVTLRRNHVSHENQTGASNNGMGFLNSAPAPTDTDRDGMPDLYEQALGWNAAVQDHNTALPNSGGFVTGVTFFPPNTPAGYTRLEEYLHFLTIPHATIPRNTAGGASSLTVDLRKFVAGFNKSPVVFALSNATNGAAVLQPDGFTVVFTPTLNYSGRARFDFTVTDGDGSAWTQTLGVLVSLAGVPRDLKWKGDGAANLWNTSATNFLEGTNRVAFSAGDNVLFDNTGSNSPNINLSVAVAPSSLEVTASKNFTFGGAGALTGGGPVRKSGSGTLTLATTNSGFTGGIELSGGTLALGSGAALGGSNMSISGGATFALPASGAAVTFGGRVEVEPGQTANIISGVLSSRMVGNFSGGEDAVLNLSGPMSFDAATSAQLDGFTGLININPGATLRFSANSSGNTFGSLAPRFIINGTLQPRNAGNTIRLGALNGAGTLAGSQSASGTGVITFDVGGDNADGHFTGIISGASTAPGSTVAFRKSGTGRQTIAGNNTHTGPTTVAAGSLFINGTNVSSPVVVSNAATLGGTGRISGLLTMHSGGALSPGDPVGTLTLAGGLTLNGATLFYDLANVTTPGGGVNDLLTMTGGALTLSGQSTVIPNPLNGVLGQGSYTLITGGSSTVGGAANLAWGGPVGGRQIFTFDTSVAGRVSLVVGGSPPASLVWRGFTNGNWDFATTNWFNGATADSFLDHDTVLFDSTGANRPAVTFATAITPASVTINAANNYTFNGPGALAGDGVLTKSGTGLLTVNTTNSAFAGPITISGGTVTLGAGANLGSGQLTLGGGATLNLAGSLQFVGNTIHVSGGQTGTVTSSGGLGNGFSGRFTSGSNGVLRVTSGVSFSGTDSAQFDGFTGTVQIQPGATFRFSANSSGNTYGSLNPAFVINGTLQPRNAGNAVRLGALSGTGTIAGPQSASGAGPTTYLIGGNNQDVTFNGVISSNTTVPGSLVVLRKIGTGTLTLNGNNTFSGGTTVESGALMVNNVIGSGTGSGTLSVEAGATLGGGGFIGSPTTLEDFATLSPGNGIGTLTFHDDLTLGEFSELNFELGTSSDAVVVNGALTLAGKLNVTATAGFGAGSYTLFTYHPTNTFNDSGLVLGSTPPGFACLLSVATPGQVKLRVFDMSSNQPVAVSLIQAGTVWKYSAQTNDLGTAWRSNSFNDAAWPSGPAMLGFGDANGLLPDTVIASNRQWTTYFRRPFFVPDASQVLALEGQILRDDAAVMYLNGAEVWRDTNMPGGVITNQTPARIALGGSAESTWLPASLDPVFLVTGTNVLAIEVHQNALTSSDLSMDFRLDSTTLVPTAMTLSVSRTSNALILSWPAAGAFGVQYATNLTPPVAWLALTNSAVFTNNEWHVTLPVATNGQRFFRLQSP
jgi:autotransporter-associated beta strand protein